MNGADIVVRRLRLLGVERVFTLCGNGLDPFHAACDRAGMELIDVHNEQAAAYMADTHARLTKSIGVCAVSSGIAHANALTGVLNSYFDGSPVLLITGSSPLTNYGLGHFQELDQVALARPVCKYAERVERVDLVRHAVDEACAAATSGRPGPVHLTIPVDVFEAEVDGNASIGPS
ncbi:MAG: thiamine pyrophosphate-binding protein, partial [Candidatus Brocadiia bacterium]|nr:thiamine pyrophosphate-binding protein [Candidatus Brocadiia bacterium]